MRRISMVLILVLVFLTACNEKIIENSGEETLGNKPTDEQTLQFELLMHLDFVPHEVGTSMTIVQDEMTYQSWAEIFKFDTIPQIDFETEEVLFVTTYSNGCGLVFDTLEKEGTMLYVTLNLPEEIRNNKEIACTEIALPNSYVIKLEKTGVTRGTLKDHNQVLLENVDILFD